MRFGRKVRYVDWTIMGLGLAFVAVVAMRLMMGS